jgi:hypothetical protein
MRRLILPEECEEINAHHRSIGFDFEIKPENCRKNPGLKMVAENLPQ